MTKKKPVPEDPFESFYKMRKQLLIVQIVENKLHLAKISQEELI
jgi:hypothetical protein